MRPQVEPERHKAERRTDLGEGSTEGELPLFKSAAAACTVRGRFRVSESYLAAFPPGKREALTGNAVGGFRRGDASPPCGYCEAVG